MKYEQKIKNDILNTAMMMDFKYVEELTVEISRRSFLFVRDKTQYLNGFLVALHCVSDDETLIGTSLLNTMLNVKAALTDTNRTQNKQLSQVTLAIAHMKKVLI